jgi:hypothetical protein
MGAISKVEEVCSVMGDRKYKPADQAGDILLNIRRIHPNFKNVLRTIEEFLGAGQCNIELG